MGAANMVPFVAKREFINNLPQGGYRGIDEM